MRDREVVSGGVFAVFNGPVGDYRVREYPVAGGGRGKEMEEPVVRDVFVFEMRVLVNGESCGGR